MPPDDLDMNEEPYQRSHPVQDTAQCSRCGYRYCPGSRELVPPHGSPVPGSVARCPGANLPPREPTITLTREQVRELAAEAIDLYVEGVVAQSNERIAKTAAVAEVVEATFAERETP